MHLIRYWNVPCSTTKTLITSRMRWSLGGHVKRIYRRIRLSVDLEVNVIDILNYFNNGDCTTNLPNTK